MESIWKEAVKGRQTKQYTGTHQTKVAVIGAGMVGILTAYLLKEAGVQVTVLEAKTLASGQTGHTTAKITSQHGMIYGHLQDYFGREGATIYAEANESAIYEYERIIKGQDIACNFERCPAYLYALKGEGEQERVEQLQKEIKLAAALGIAAEFTTQTELPFHVAGAEVFHNQACFHPLKFINHLAQELDIYEFSQVREIKDNCLYLDGGILEAEHIVFASHYPWPVIPGYYFLRMHQERSYVLALHQEKPLQGMYRDVDPDGLSFRSYGEYLLMGGSGHHTGKNKEGGNYDALRTQAKQWYPKAAELAHWSAQDCVTLDKVPYIGLLTASVPNWYVAAGFGKWGMTSSMVSAIILRDMILAKENPWKELFAPQRMNWKASMPQLCGNIGSAVTNLSKRLLFYPMKTAEKLAPGEGNVVRYQGKKVGVYKDLDGKIYAVEAGCQHMGCQLAFNPEEKTWDCPCHGSRYNYKGELICGPSQKPLKGY